jgi:hypothetical protein
MQETKITLMNKTIHSRLTRQQELMLVPYIINYVGEYFNANVGYTLNKARDKDAIHHKYICIYLITENTKYLSLKEIGGYFEKDHSSIIHARKRINNYLFYDSDIRREIFEIQTKINITIENLINNIFDLKVEHEFYRLNLDSFVSIKIHGCEKFVICANFTDTELDVIKSLFNTTETRKHTNTGIYICEPINQKYYGNKGQEAESKDSRKSNKGNSK